MELIQELPLAQQIATGAAVVLVLVLLFVAIRRRKAATRPETVAATPSRKERRAEKKAAKSSVPRRKRRKLAAEVAHAMDAQAPQPDIVVPPVELAPPAVAEVSVEPVTPIEVPAPAVAAPVIEDPYVTGADITPGYPASATEGFVEYDEDGAVVADPGWPAPGELASSFDPDAFDPLPDHDDYPPAESPYAAVSADEHEDVVEPIELPDLALEEIELPTLAAPGAAPAVQDSYDDDDFDPASGWSDGETQVISTDEAAEWDVTPTAPSVTPVAEHAPDAEATVDLDQFWGEPDRDEWDETPAGELQEPESHPAAETPAPVEVSAEPPAAEEVLENWDEDAEDPWNATETPAVFEDLTVPFPLPGTIPTHGGTPSAPWSSGPLQSGPVVLDLAGLANSGQPLELVIEPNSDGNGVRLRFAAPGASGADATPIEVALRTVSEDDAAVDVPDESVAMDEDPASNDATFDVPFLTGGAVSEVVVETPTDAPVTEEPARETALLLVEPAIAAEAPVAEAPHAPVSAEPDLPVSAAETPDVAEDPYGADDDDAFQDDSAKILADIRARLAELDARRHAHS